MNEECNCRSKIDGKMVKKQGNCGFKTHLCLSCLKQREEEIRIEKHRMRKLAFHPDETKAKRFR